MPNAAGTPECVRESDEPCLRAQMCNDMIEAAEERSVE